MTITFRGRPTWAEIDLDAVAANVRALLKHVGPTVKLAAVVKANAYGHGMEQVAVTAVSAGASWLAVNTVDEGVRLRRAELKCPVLILGYVPTWQAEEVVTFRLTPTINTLETAEAIAEEAAERGRMVSVHIKIDTGLGRFGLLPDEVLPFVQAIQTMAFLRLEGLWTHFASADETEKTYTRQQLAVYQSVLETLEQHNIHIEVRHTANSAGTLDVPETHFDMVRCGISLYGLYPSADVSRTVPLRPVMALKSRVARLRTLPAGSSISYGRTYVTSKPTTVALIPIGYADGLVRALSNKGQVLIHGQRAPILGRVCMDQCVVSVDGIDGIAQDDEVVVIGRDGDSEITTDEVAETAGTIGYEITTGISARVPRVFLRGGQIWDMS